MKFARQASPWFVATLALSAWAQGIDYAKIEILTEQISPNLYILSGSGGADPGHQDAAGGRIGVLVGPDGIFMVDAQYAQITDKIVAAIRKIRPTRFSTRPQGELWKGKELKTPKDMFSGLRAMSMRKP